MTDSEDEDGTRARDLVVFLLLALFAGTFITLAVALGGGVGD
ncbi:MAG: hypothetical protein ABTQ29_01380 [Siculibacillus sp.]